METEEEVVPVGPVQSTKDIVADKQRSADEKTPDDMQLVGWMLDGWVAPYPLLSDNARPVYAFIPPIAEEEEEVVE